MPKRRNPLSGSAAVHAAVQAREEESRAIEPLEMHLTPSKSKPDYWPWVWALLALSAIVLVTWASAGAPHPAIPWAGLGMAVLAGLVAAWYGLRHRG